MSPKVHPAKFVDVSHTLKKQEPKKGLPHGLDPDAAPVVTDHREPARLERGTAGSAHPSISRNFRNPGSTGPDDHVGSQQAIPPQGARAPLSAAGLALPHERDQSTNTTAAVPDPKILQAKRDIDAGLVDTDMHATPGLDAKRRAHLVPGPGGKPPPSGD